MTFEELSDIARRMVSASRWNNTSIFAQHGSTCDYLVVNIVGIKRYIVIPASFFNPSRLQAQIIDENVVEIGIIDTPTTLHTVNLFSIKVDNYYTEENDEPELVFNAPGDGYSTIQPNTDVSESFFSGLFAETELNGDVYEELNRLALLIIDEFRTCAEKFLKGG